MKGKSNKNFKDEIWHLYVYVYLSICLFVYLSIIYLSVVLGFELT
jgi:hypothetical protein